MATLSIETSDPSADRVVVEAPATFDAGEVEIELRNRGDMLHDAQLFRVDGDRRAADVVSVLELADSAPKPAWLHPAGGVAATGPGQTARVHQVLEPGTYYVADTQERDDPSGARSTNAAKRGIVRIEVGGSASGALPDTPALITATDYDFESSGIVAGSNQVTFRNAGREIHQAVALPIPRGMPSAAGESWVLDAEVDTGWVPVDVPHSRATAALDGGDEQVTEMTLSPGRYVLVCFVSDRKGGPAHLRRGMTAALTVQPEHTATADGG